MKMRIINLIFFQLLCLKHYTEANGFNNPFFPFGGGGNSQDAEDLKKFQCPSQGRFAFKIPNQDNCKKYYDCFAPGVQPLQINRCIGNDVFNKLSRSCVPKASGNCNWCIQQGRHVDKTSNLHFIECVPGSIAIRYRCKKGKYDPTSKSCKTLAWKVMDLTVDAVFDPPLDILSYMKTWKEKETDEQESIEEGPKGNTDAKENEEEGNTDTDDNPNASFEQKPKKPGKVAGKPSGKAKGKKEKEKKQPEEEDPA